MSEPIKGREPFSMLIHAIERDLERTPDGNGGEIYYFPATEKHGSMGHNGEYLLKEWQEVAADLCAQRDRADRAERDLDSTNAIVEGVVQALTEAPEECDAASVIAALNLRLLITRVSTEANTDATPAPEEDYRRHRCYWCQRSRHSDCIGCDCTFCDHARLDREDKV